MGIDQKILVRARGLVVFVATVGLLTACGQKGGLYMPNDPDFKDRATLPDLVRRQLPGATPAAKSASSAAPSAASQSTPVASAPAGR
jgi:predicted small lipoprotein YifL